jgi:hypothetical protein
MGTRGPNPFGERLGLDAVILPHIAYSIGNDAIDHLQLVRRDHSHALHS